MEKAEIIIVAGFTGAGKTTYINERLSETDGPKKTLVILNDFGAEGLKNSVLCEEWKSSCPCCEGQRFFALNLQNAFYKYRPERIFIEVSQMASIEEMKRIFDMKLSFRFVESVKFIYVENIRDNIRRELISGELIRSQKENADVIIQYDHSF